MSGVYPKLLTHSYAEVVQPDLRKMLRSSIEMRIEGRSRPQDKGQGGFTHIAFPDTRHQSDVIIMGDYVLDLAKRRKTVRRYSSGSIDLKQVLKALEAACQAPSGANSQPWRFLIVTDTKVKRRVREACESGEKTFYSGVKGELGKWLHAKGLSWQKPFLEEAPVLVLVFSETKAPYAIQSVWLAIGHILLALEEAGLSTMTYTPSVTRGIIEKMGLPKGFRLEAILPVGISADEKTKEPKLALHQVAYLNSWGHCLDTIALSSEPTSR